MLEAGEQKMAALGDTTLDAAGKVEKAEAALKDAKSALAELAVAALDAGGTLDALSTNASYIRRLTDTIDELGFSYRAMWAHNIAGLFKGDEAALMAYTQAMVKMGRVTVDAAEGQRLLSGEYERTSPPIEKIQRAVDVTEEFADVTNRAKEAQDRAARAADRYDEALRQQAVAAMEVSEAQLGIAEQYTGYQESVTEAAESFAERREQIEQDHSDKVAEIAKKGQSWRKRIDEQATSLELRIAQGRLAELRERQQEYNEDTTDLERARTEQSIRRLEGEISEKTGLLQQAHDGYIVMQGQNVDALLSEEDRRYNESVRKLEEAQAEQEAAQRESLGRMILQHFNAWVEMNLATDGFTEEEADYATRMRKEISSQYGLVTDAAIQSLEEQEKRWERTFSVLISIPKVPGILNQSKQKELSASFPRLWTQQVFLSMLIDRTSADLRTPDC
jgi:hypothetical protein